MLRKLRSWGVVSWLVRMAGLLACGLLPADDQAQTMPAAPPSLSPSVADPGDWPMYGHDPSRTNYNPAETTISSANVDQLISRWQVLLPNIPDSLSASTPSIANGRV